MRRFTTLIFALTAAAAFAQAPFTIVRPADGAKVRETVHVQVPLSSVPIGGYVGVYIKDQFIEALVPNAHGNYYDIPLDTHQLRIADGLTKIELVLFVDFNDEPRIVDRSSVTVNVKNLANIGLPAAGLILRYHFVPGTETTYHVANRVVEQSLSAARLARGNKAVDLPIEAEDLRVDYDVINAYDGGEGLLLLQSQPAQGAKRAFVETLANPAGQWYQANEFGQAYERVSSTGYEISGSIPESFTLEGTAPTPPLPNDIWYLEALPNLPIRRVKPGQSWQTRILFPSFDLGDIHDAKHIMQPIPARGEFVDVEWEMGRPCAKIVNAADITGGFPRNVTATHMQEIETVWYALDRGEVQKMVRYIVVDRPSQEAVQQAAGPVAGPAAPTFGTSAPNGADADMAAHIAAAAGARYGPGRRRDDNEFHVPPGGQGYGYGGGTPPPMPSFGSNGAAQPMAAGPMTDRTVIEETFTLAG